MAGPPSGSTATTPTRSPPRSSARRSSDRPSLIACRTIIAFGAPTKAGTAAAHGSPLGAAEIAGARERLGWNYPPFVDPRRCPRGMARGAARAAPRSAKPGRRGCKRSRPSKRGEFAAPPSAASCPPISTRRSPNCATSFRKANAKIATRQASGTVLDTLTRVVPELVGGSADLTPVEQHQGQGSEGGPARRFFRPLHPLRRARARHGGGDERHRRAWRADPLWRHLSDLLRLLPGPRSACRRSWGPASSM